MISCFNRVGCYLFKLWADFLNKLIISFMLLIKIFLKIGIAQFISIFILSIFITMDLNSVVGQMDIFIVCVIELIFVTTGADIAFIIPVAFYEAVLSKIEDVPNGLVTCSNGCRICAGCRARACLCIFEL